ncbi:uncharacterized transmembrane protein DDB_G0289901-like [Selaginella moellendorffii]|uniref:uncharacterized transmembrane protein DDB_G0289901-like n=1 Tax=Selaginella moellendorffii TaxID=88036 RepID=UPI000D1D0ECF|nr:uncharacterized transmembrane protein DDB_G0289901-like [Selaginella moellendorffii]|eukprot:XP_024522738.1 uncharacterized transmembrane protein DDB_G0289901-like [Selaginella moellendorffii]
MEIITVTPEIVNSWDPIWRRKSLEFDDMLIRHLETRQLAGTMFQIIDDLSEDDIRQHYGDDLATLVRHSCTRNDGTTWFSNPISFMLAVWCKGFNSGFGSNPGNSPGGFSAQGRNPGWSPSPEGNAGGGYGRSNSGGPGNSPGGFNNLGSNSGGSGSSPGGFNNPSQGGFSNPSSGAGGGGFNPASRYNTGNNNGYNPGGGSNPGGYNPAQQQPQQQQQQQGPPGNP